MGDRKVAFVSGCKAPITGVKATKSIRGRMLLIGVFACSCAVSTPPFSWPRCDGCSVSFGALARRALCLACHVARRRRETRQDAVHQVVSILLTRYIQYEYVATSTQTETWTSTAWRNAAAVPNKALPSRPGCLIGIVRCCASCSSLPLFCGGVDCRSCCTFCVEVDPGLQAKRLCCVYQPLGHTICLFFCLSSRLHFCGVYVTARRS